VSAPLRHTLLRHAPLAACAAVLVWRSLQFDFITDDAYITFVYARNLAEHGELAFNLGLDPVEGFTNFLWAVSLAAGMVLGIPPEVSAKVLAAGFAVGTLVVCWRLMAWVRGDEPEPPTAAPRPASAWDLLPGVFLSLSAGYACWTAGGLETQMFTFWVSVAIHAYLRSDGDPRRWRLLGVWLALAAMTRPEGALVAAVIGAHRIVLNVTRERRLRPSRGELGCVAAFATLWLPYFAWRWWYFGSPFPNTYYVKAGGAPPPGYRAELLANGLYYLAQWAKQSGALAIAPAAAVGVLAARRGSRRRAFGTLAVALTVVYLAYVARVGGDFMGLHRFVMPVFVLVALCAALGLRWLVGRVSMPAVRSQVAAMGLVWLLGAYAHTQHELSRAAMRWGNWASDHGIDTPAFLAVYTADRAVIGEHLSTCMRADDFSILGGAGAQPYYGRMRGVDVFGLVSEEIAHEVPATRPRAGHNKWAPDAFLLGRYDPTFVFHCYSIHPDPRRPQWNCDPGFWRRNGYDQVTLHIPGLRQQGAYYSFWKKRERVFDCPGVVEP
jgi:hypothetical protein